VRVGGVGTGRKRGREGERAIEHGRE